MAEENQVELDLGTEEEVEVEAEAPQEPEKKEPKKLGAVIRFTIKKMQRPEPEEGEEPVKGPYLIEID